MDFDIVIPGHGPVADKAGLAAHRDSIEKFRNRAWSLIHGGQSDEEVTTGYRGKKTGGLRTTSISGGPCQEC